MIPAFFVAGILNFGVEWISLSAAFLLATVFLIRGKAAKDVGRTVPWGIVFFVLGLFLVVAAARDNGLGEQVAELMASLNGSNWWSLLGSTGAAAVLANLINNLPAYLILGPEVGGADQLSTVLVGVNAGPMITPLGSLATVLWLHLLRRHDAEAPGTSQILKLGLVATPILFAGVVGVWLVS